MSHTSRRILCAVDDGAGLGREQREQVELLQRELELAAVERRAPRAARRPRARRPTSVSRAVRPRRTCASSDGADARDELAQPERLDDVVVRAELEPDDAVDLLALGGDHDDRDVRASAQLAADGEPVDVGQAEVEQDEVGRRRVERLLPRRDARHLEALRAQALDERLGDRVLVLDDEQVHGLIVGRRAPAGVGCVTQSGRSPYLRLARDLPRRAYLRRSTFEPEVIP